MAVQNVSSAVTNIFSGPSQKTTNASSSANGSASFSSVLKQSIEALNQEQNNSDSLITKLANGENVDLYQVMIAAQKANISMQTALEIRNKAVEGYQEIMRMQV
ncbi:flagellar hook-basal body complex protein FliE [Weizmannia acidilactici]|uniref:Flagellar hook-basal body complex protein FliE n=1 Tax=Weizmannia acidilactici TaxID=2607726 RepID=A0A5J4JBC2_9BACI|nr:flagellar hook-basal body complex protein FliE [Weizmannia acidilactici]GER65619.1 flagellar hook-basal body complex protein FliE [Weizmannia acidilactici]GER69051.1 flagellar hook-basal body complex protein FliE [Weizmannia acidilactici]GER71976.1 flagellar hook-basal body complex protein FliE [Weizmannia acidilactici]